MSPSASSNKRSTWKRLPRSDPSLTSLCNRFVEMSITPGEATSSSSIPKRKRSSLEAFTAASSSIQEIKRRFKHSSEPEIMASTSTSSTQNSFKYDIFLSFRGEDTRKSFVDHLYHALMRKGIYTYKDDENIKQGNMISDELIKAIENSKFYIIVFSKSYASSSWCLQELAKIMECQKMDEHTAYPVFYDVKPTEVRKQIGAVGKAFAKHKKEAAAGKWREALKEASDLAGFELESMANGKIVQLWEDGEGKVLYNLRFLTFFESKLRTFDVGFAPNLEQLTISDCEDFVELHIPAHHHSKLQHLDLSLNPKLTNLHLGNTPNLKTLMLNDCDELVLLPELGRVRCLKELDIQNTGIRRLPQSILQMKGLRIIGSTEIFESYGLTYKIQTSNKGEWNEETFGVYES